MSNDGWGKMPTNDDWAKPAKRQSFEAETNGHDMSLTDTPTPETWDGAWPEENTWPVLSEDHPDHPDCKVAPAVSDGWGSWTDEKSVQDWLTPTRAEIEQQREEQWTHNALEGAQNRAAVINSINERKDEYTIDRDGELSNINETVRAKRQSDETGWYLCYKEKWLHAIISGPYTTANEALLRSERAWSMFTEDAAFKLAFENKFNRDGLYCAEIPLSLKRRGAYGVLT